MNTYITIHKYTIHIQYIYYLYKTFVITEKTKGHTLESDLKWKEIKIEKNEKHHKSGLSLWQIVSLKLVFENCKRFSPPQRQRKRIPQTNGGPGKRVMIKLRRRWRYGKKTILGWSKRGHELKTLLKIAGSSGIKENAIQKSENMSVTAKTDREPLEMIAIVGDMVIFPQTEYEPDTDILDALKLIQLLLCEIKIANISII